MLRNMLAIGRSFLISSTVVPVGFLSFLSGLGSCLLPLIFMPLVYLLLNSSSTTADALEVVSGERRWFLADFPAELQRIRNILCNRETEVCPCRKGSTVKHFRFLRLCSPCP